MGIWDFLQKRENREVLGFVGAGAAAVIVGAWTLFTYLDSRQTPAQAPAQKAEQAPATAGDTNPLVSAANQAANAEYHGEGIDVAFAGMQASSSGLTGDLPRLVLQYVNFATKPVSIDKVLCNFNKWQVPNANPAKTLNATVEIFPVNGVYIELNPEEKKTVSYELFVQSDTGIHGESTISSCKITYFIKTSSAYSTTRTASVMLGN